MESLKSAITNIIPEFSATITEHIVYPFEVNNKINDLESATRALVAMKADVKTVIENAERENNVPTQQAAEWLRKVDAIEKEAEEIQENNRKRRRSVLSDYMTSKTAVKMLNEVKSLCDQKETVEVTMHLPPPLAQEMPAASEKSSNLESALHYIKDDMHNIIGIWGMGGVGKTHLLKQINNELCKDCAFDVVIFVTCSKECSQEKVQNDIIDRLGLNKNSSKQHKQSMIYKFLSRRSFVLLLDDVWCRIDLDIIGIPNSTAIISTCKRKVVLTTRSTEVCGQMEVRKKIRVDVLNWVDAWSLFKEKVTEETINSDPVIQRCAVDVAKELGGLPLALITVGRAMHDSTDPSEWELAVERLEQSNLHEVKFAVKDESVFQTLRFSYDSLRNETLKKCFLHCSLWPENYAINKDKLIQLWMGLGLFDKLKNEINVTIQKEKNEITNGYLIGYNCIRRLQALCLLEAVDGDREVRMHDLIRDMALWIVNKQGVERYKSIIQYGAHKEDLMIEISSDTEIISLMHAQTKISLSSTCSSTRLSTVLLNNNQLCDSKPLELALFSKLTFLDLSSNNFEVFPDEICKLVHLLLLNLSWNSKLKSLPKDLMALINLKYLLLRGLEYCNIPNGVLSKLKALRVLDLHYSYHGRGTEGNLRTFSSLEEELRCLLHFQALGITISSMHDYQKLSQMTTVPIRSLDIKNFEVEDSRLSISGNLLGNPQLQNNLVSLEIRGMSVEWIKFERRNYDQSICHLEKLEKLSFNWMKKMKVVWMGLDPKDVFSRLQCLHFVFCDQLTSISWVACLPCIRELSVWQCRNVKQLICTDELNNAGLSACQPSFPFLKEMTLCSNVELEYISDPKITYPALEILLVDTCNKLKKLPFKTENPPRNLRFWGTEEWWNNIEMDDVTHRSSLQSFFNKTFY